MSYEPTNWKSGDVVTSAKLNKLEQGVAGAGAFIVTITGTPDEETGEAIYTADHTVSEIQAAAESGQIVMAHQMWQETGEEPMLEKIFWFTSVNSSYADFSCVSVYSSGSAPQFSIHCARVAADNVNIYDQTLS